MNDAIRQGYQHDPTAADTSACRRCAGMVRGRDTAWRRAVWEGHERSVAADAGRASEDAAMARARGCKAVPPRPHADTHCDCGAPAVSWNPTRCAEGDACGMHNFDTERHPHA